MAQEVFLYLPLDVLDEKFVLSTGLRIPKIALSTSYIDEFEKIYNLVDLALQVGYRSFDCSPQRMEEENLGVALEALLPKHSLKRSDILITSKIHPRDYGKESTTEAFWHSCERLKTDYIDLFLMQWPGGHNLGSDGDESRRLRIDTWKEIVNLNNLGVVRSPGVCHFTTACLESIRGFTSKMPSINQVEFHPRYPQIELLEYCNNNNILMQACSFKETFHPLLLNDEVVTSVANSLNKTPTQILLKWVINKNVGVISHSENPKKIHQNFHLFSFGLEKRDMDLINSIKIREKYLRKPVFMM